MKWQPNDPEIMARTVKMHFLSRRRFLQWTAGGIAASYASSDRRAAAQAESQQPTIELLLPRNRVPLSFIIDDSTCLVNMGHFCMPQFAEAWPDREIYRRPWKNWPREIPDSFVREFGEWCAEQGVKGKYSVVPYPACVGWLDRGLPGWSNDALNQSLQLVRELMVPNWDIHPEMITHTRVIDVKTGRPVEGANDATMENSFPQHDISTDELASYLAFALRILKNCGLPCEGITTPGGFGNRVKDKLPLAVHQAVRDVFGAELPHFFKYVAEDLNTEPKLEFFAGKRDISQLTMNIPAGTGDWFGGWDGDERCQADLYANADATSGRMVELIEHGKPAIMLCHWPGLYTHGTKQGFADFQKVVIALHERFSTRTQWMKLSEIGRYWAAKELTEINVGQDRSLSINAPIACADFTVRFRAQRGKPPVLHSGQSMQQLKRVSSRELLARSTYWSSDDETITCFDLPQGQSRLAL
jgi:hypothetical protein